MACYSGGAKGLILDYASDEGAEMAPLTPETRAKLPAMIDPASPPKSLGRRSYRRRARRQSLRKSARSSAPIRPSISLPCRASCRSTLPIPYNPEPLHGVFASTDKPVLAFGRIAQNASDISRQFQNKTGVPLHPRPAPNRARVAGFWSTMRRRCAAALAQWQSRARACRKAWKRRRRPFAARWRMG